MILIIVILIYLLIVLDTHALILIKKDNEKLVNEVIMFIKDWRNFLSFTIAWMITNGWCYVFIFLGIILKVNWLKIVGSSYLAFLWLPCTPEKLVTIPLSVFIKKTIFKRREENDRTKRNSRVNELKRLQRKIYR